MATGDLNQALVQFNDIFGDGANQFPAGGAISSATLKLYVTKTENSTGTQYAMAWPMMSDWAEGTAESWTVEEGASCGWARYTRVDPGDYVAGDYWGTGGVVAPGPVKGVDYNCDGTSSSNAYMGASGSSEYWLEFDVTSVVIAWQAGEYDNNGFYIYGHGSWDYVDFYTSEASTVAYRPILEIIPAPSIPVPADTAFFKQGYQSRE